jgi:hypothetical protein
VQHLAYTGLCGCRYDTDEQHFLACIANALPTEYKAILAAERRQNGGVITMDDAEDCLEEYFRQAYGDKDKATAETDPEMTFTMVPGKKCWSCGSTEHVKSECPKPKKSKDKDKNNKDNKGSIVTCGRCGKAGHATDACWKDPKNESKRPQWLKDKLKKAQSTEVASSIITSYPKTSNGGTYEFLCSSVTATFDQRSFPTI